MASKTLTRSIADGIARRGLPFSAFRNEEEWKDTLVFLADAVDAALIAYGAEREQAERERAAKIVNRTYGCYVHDQPSQCAECALRHKVIAAIKEGKPQ